MMTFTVRTFLGVSICVSTCLDHLVMTVLRFLVVLVALLGLFVFVSLFRRVGGDWNFFFLGRLRVGDASFDLLALQIRQWVPAWS
jgi:hypothetical protein